MSVGRHGLPAAIAGLDRTEAKARPASESLGRRPVAQDQAADRSGVVARLERLGHGAEPPVAYVDVDAWVGGQVACPLGVVARCDEDRAVRLIDEADSDRPRLPRPATARRDPGDLALEEEVGADVVRARLRQRDRCQDLPSVWVDGA
jgi:hypothetical protein